MSVYLGNLSFKQLAELHEFELTDEELEILEGLRTENASFNAGENKCHIFDMPRIIHCGTKSVFNTVYNILSKKPVKGQIQIGLV